MSHEPKLLPADDRVGTRFGEYRIDAALDRKLAEHGRLELPTTVRICAHVADGLHAL
jgi:hypothetical protein